MIELLKTVDYSVKSPKYNVGKDAGIDFFVPEYSEAFLRELLKKNEFVTTGFDVDTGKYYIYVAPHKDINIPSGIYSKLPSNIALVGANKSGIASKKKLVYGAHIIDASYQGIIHLHMINTSDDWQKIYFGEKVVQFIPLVVDISGIEVKDESDTPRNVFFPEATERGSGGFGSTGLN